MAPPVYAAPATTVMAPPVYAAPAAMVMASPGYASEPTYAAPLDLFSTIDRNHDGVITRDEFNRVLG